MNIVVNLNKDQGMTSQEAVTAVKKIFKVRKAGHAGTLDPLATGVLLICLNEATKAAALLSDMDKEYVVTIRLGMRTATFDAEGPVIETVSGFTISEIDLRHALDRFRGEIQQIPPMYSAVKKNGSPLYKLARKGIAVERSPRTVTIRTLELLDYDSPLVTLRLSCSKGTYVRTLCSDIGDVLGVGAYVTALTRSRIGAFCLDEAARLSDLPAAPKALHSLDDALAHLPRLILTDGETVQAQHGAPVMVPSSRGIFHDAAPADVLPEGDGGCLVRMLNPDGRLFGIGRIRAGQLRVQRLLKL